MTDNTQFDITGGRQLMWLPPHFLVDRIVGHIDHLNENMIVIMDTLLNKCEGRFFLDSQQPSDWMTSDIIYTIGYENHEEAIYFKLIMLQEIK